MDVARPRDRRAFREYPLDGAALYFQPATGVHVRVARATTHHLRRRAPRVAMFGITNACNLACGFCSRDLGRPSAWTVATAAAALRGLCDAGTLEVAYGGGEPFAFRGFAELVAELDVTTALAQHVTTNGTLIDAAMWSRFAGRFGQVRVSIYEPATWRTAAAVLAGARQRWGANLLVDAAALAALPLTLAELAAHGCGDVSLLSYVGPDPARHLDRAGAERLAAIIEDSPLPCRLSVCFGDHVPVPRLPTGDAPGDCGAGRDFVSITPDRRVQSCSFQDRSLPGATADEILAAWRTQPAILAAPSPRRGCARGRALAREPVAPPPGIAIWQGFSGNNSGECLLVASFDTVADAEAYLAELAPGWTPDGAYSPAWRQLFADEGVLGANVDGRFDDDASPRELLAIGRSVIAVQYAAEDAFPELRALAWKRGAHVVAGGIHVHDGITLLGAVDTADAADRARVLAAPRPAAARLHVHGDTVLVVLPVLDRAGEASTLAAARAALVALADGRPLAGELYFDALDDAALVSALARLGHRPAQRPRLWVTFWGQTAEEDAVAFARTLPGDRTTRVATSLLVDPAPDRKRLAVLAHRRGGHVAALDGATVRLRAGLWFEQPPRQRGQRPPPPPAFDRERLEAVLRGTLPPATTLEVTWPARHYQPGPDLAITTAEPAAALRVVDDYRRGLGARVNLWAADLDPLGAALRRLRDGLTPPRGSAGAGAG